MSVDMLRKLILVLDADERVLGELDDLKDHQALAKLIEAERADAKAMGEAMRRRRQSGWKPLGSSPPKFKGMAQRLDLRQINKSQDTSTNDRSRTADMAH